MKASPRSGGCWFRPAATGLRAAPATRSGASAGAAGTGLGSRAAGATAPGFDFYRRFDDPKVELTELHDLGNGITFVVLASEGRIPGGEGVVTEHPAQIYEWVEGLVARVIDYRDIDEARADAERLAPERE